MTNRDKLKQILQVLDPQKGTGVDFAQFDMEVQKLKDAVTEKVQIQTLDDVNSQLDSFKKKLNLKPMLEALGNLETTLDLKIQGVTGLLTEETTTLKKLLKERDAVSTDKIASLASNIDLLKSELTNLTTQKNTEVASLKIELDQLQEFEKSTDVTFSQIQTTLEENDLESEVQFQTLTDSLEKFRKEFNNRLSNLGGGAMNRQVLFNSTDYLKKYTDINWKAGTNVTFTVVDNNATKKVDITVSATGGSGSGIVRSINSISSDTPAGSASTTDYVYICTSTLTVTLPDATTNTNLYTIKNVGTGVVTINTTSSQTIDGALTIVMPLQYTAVDLVSDTAGWNVT